MESPIHLPDISISIGITSLRFTSSPLFYNFEKIQFVLCMRREEIVAKLIEEKVFWSYDVQKKAPIPDEVLIEKTLIYLDLEEIDALFELFSYEKIKEVWLQKVKSQEPRLHNLNLFLGKWYFDK